MANLLQLRDGAKAYGAKKLFSQATFSVGEGEHIGVIGPNGAGKTTLFKALIGEEALDDGEIVRSRQLRLGYLSQHDAWNAGDTVEDYLARECQMPLWSLKALALGLGLTEEHFVRPIASLSGGYRMRIKLLYLIGQEPNLMLLDEPTNYLDLETLLVLENFLQGYEGAFLVISHDREFLRRTTSHTLEVEGGDVTKYPGNIDDYFEQKALLRSQLEARAQSDADKRKEILDFVARFGAKATKASQAQSRLKALEKMETIELKALPVRARIRIPEPTRTGKLVFELKGVAMGYPGQGKSPPVQVIQPVNLQVLASDHIAIVGLNGAGKSTLLKTLAKALPTLSGSIDYGYQVTVGYYAQHVAERLDLTQTVLEALELTAAPDLTRQDVLNLAGALLFGGDDVKKKIAVLSGGERARVALGQILLARTSCIILDEPTNHLDFDTVEALTQALTEYKGTVIAVSHDRSFIRRLGTKILEINHGQLNLHEGTYDDYVWRIQRQSLESAGLSNAAGPPKPARSEKSPDKSPDKSGEKSPERPGEGPSGAAYREAKKALDREAKQTEKAIATLEAQITERVRKTAELKDQIERDPTPGAHGLIEALNQVQIELHPLEEQWLSLTEKREQIDAKVRELMRGQN